MESRLGLRQIDEILRDAFRLQGGDDHVVITTGSCIGAFEAAASVARKVGDVASDLVGHHQRQVGVRVLDLSLRFGFDAGIGGRGKFVGYVDGRRLGFLLGILRVGAPRIEFVDAGDHVVEFLLQAVVGADIEIAAQQRVQSIVEILLSIFGLAGLLVGQSRLVFLFSPGDQIGDRVGSWSRSWSGLRRSRLLTRSILRLRDCGLRTGGWS